MPERGRAFTFLRLSARAAVRGLIEFSMGRDLTYAASIAYYTLLSFFPCLLLTFSIVGRVTRGHDEATMVRLVAIVLPAHFDFVMAQLAAFAHAPLRFSIIGTVIIVWSSTGMFSALTSGINYAWGVEQLPSFVKQKFISFLMLGASGLLLLATLVFVSAVQFVQTRVSAPIVTAVPWLMHLGGLASRLAATPLFILVVALIYYYVPNTRVRLRDVWVGAILAGVLWRAAFGVFSWYLGDFSRLSVMDGSIAAVVGFLVWVYASAVILLYGAEVSAAFSLIEKGASAAEAAKTAVRQPPYS